MDDVLKLYASFEDGKLTIERQDGKPLSFDYGNCIEVLEIGNTGNAVCALQALLNCHGKNLKIDGIFGNLTLNALSMFQRSKDLTETGTCDFSTWLALIGSD